MADSEKVIKTYEDFINGYECFCISDDYEYEMHKAVLSMLKEQERLLRKKQKDIDKLCAEYSNLKHRFHEKTEIVRCKDCKHWDYRTEGCMHLTGRIAPIVKTDWFCADGQRKE